MKIDPTTAVLALLLSATLSGTPGLATASLLAPGFPFTVNESAIPGAAPRTLQADGITGVYTAVISAGPNDNMGFFDMSLHWQATQFSFTQGPGPSGSIPVGSQLGDSSETQYGLYALYHTRGVMAPTSTGITELSFVPLAEFQLFVDPESDTRFHLPDDGAGRFLTSGADDDLLLASGLNTQGFGRNDATFTTCDSGDWLDVGCNRFLTQNQIRLSDEGQRYFVAPVPFWALGFQYAQFEPFAVSGTQVIDGTMDFAFDGLCCANIAEPPSMALLALGLLGLVITRRRLM